MATPNFTQAQVDALAAKYAEGIISGSVTVEGRSRSFSYGSLTAMWEAIQNMQQAVNSANTGTPRKSFSFTTHNRGY